MAIQIEQLNSKEHNHGTWKDIFLPNGYPDSVSKDYWDYQFWDTLQAGCSRITGLLSTRATLVGLGVGNESATASAALIQWVLMDGAGMLGSIVFAWKIGKQFDADCKKWRLMADILNDFGLFLSLCATQVTQNQWFFHCMGNLFRAMCGVCGGATKSALTIHFAIKDNAADVSAKDGSQETIVNLISTIIGTFLVTKIIPDVPVWNWGLFVFLTICHLLFNYWAVNSVVFSTLNRQRYFILTREYAMSKRLLNPTQVAEMESIFWKEPFPKIRLGCSRLDMSNDCMPHWSAKLFREAMILDNFDLFLQNDQIFIFIHEIASPKDIIHAYFTALILQGTLSQNIKDKTSLDLYHEAKALSQEFFGNFWNELSSSGWIVSDHQFDLLYADSWRIKHCYVPGKKTQ